MTIAAKPKKLKSWKKDTKPHERMIERSVVIRVVEGTQGNADAVPTLTAVIASEHPVERWDEQRKEVVREILLTDGMEFRDGKNQLPIVDSHDRGTVRNVLGSIRNIQIQGDEVVGQPMFARDANSQEAMMKVIDGHINDFSITADPLEIVEIPRGKTGQFGERLIEGPANVVTRWQPTDASLVAAGADVRSKVRRSYELSKGIARAMTAEAIAKLVEKGMPSDLTDPEQIMAWVLGNLSASDESSVTSTMGEMEYAEGGMMPEEEVIENMDGEKPEEVKNAKPVATKTRSLDRNSVLVAERKRIKEINALGEKANIERTVVDRWISEGTSLELVREKVIERMAANATSTGTSAGADVRVTASGDDKFMAAIQDGLLMRCQTASRVQRSLVGAKPAPGSEEFGRGNLVRIAEEILRRAGVSTHRFSAPEIAKAAMGNRSMLERMGIRRDSAYHTTGSFANLLLNASNKTLLAAYEEAPYTWSLWARQATSVDDFKPINRMRFSESPDLEVVPESKEYPEGVMSDSRESYSVEKFGKMFSISWETVVNDDLDAISRIPAMHGAAARRTQNKKVYEVLTSNPTMGDGVALFGAHASGTNTSGGAGAPAVGTLNTAFSAMMRQKGLNSDVTLSIIPKFLIVPVAYSATALELVNSVSYNAANNNEGVKNIYGIGGPRPLTVIAEPTLDANSSTIWYLAAEPSQIDTVELSFLAGEESPVLETEWKFETDTYLNKVRQTFGVKAIDWRGLYRNSA
jgi:hypothetical protein